MCSCKQTFAQDWIARFSRVRFRAHLAKILLVSVLGSGYSTVDDPPRASRRTSIPGVPLHACD
jgi:hypothetical protein